MNTYFLVKLVSSVAQVDSRMRLQKCLYLLQVAGCELEAEYCLHYYGPYSHDVAGSVDKLSSIGALGALKETATPNSAGIRYSYEITDTGKKLLADYEQTAEGKKALESVEAYVARFGELARVPLRRIELAATIAFYRQRGESWSEAANLTARVNSGIMQAAQKLARDFAI